MPHLKHHIQFATTILLLTIKLTSSATSKSNASPVYEVINEQARIDDKPKVSNSPGILPYGNPLAGNSKQNARIHASNQQAMFNAERIRQHKAQLQRWMKGPQIIDSYMKAYHELQENHQLELEEQQATLKDSPVTPATRGRPLRQRGPNKRKQNTDDTVQTVQNEPSNVSSKAQRIQSQRKDLPRRGSSIQRSEPTKITKADAVIKTRSRNHRSYGSADYHQYLEPTRYKTVYISSVPSYGQGVNINPHGSIGLSNLQTKEPSKLYTQAVPSESPPTYAKQYGVQKFNSVQEIEALNSLLSKNPTEQLSEFNALVGSEKNTDEGDKEIPVDFYFYLKGPAQTASDNLEPTKYTSEYMQSFPVKDHTPITEETDDIEDPTKNKRPITFSQTPATTAPKIETITTKSNNYYKVEVASQVISDDTTASQVTYLKDDDKSYRALNYGYQPYYAENGDTSERFLHYNAQPTGVQHLAEDGTETSAYGDDDVSIPLDTTKTPNKIRIKRSKLETEPFLLPNEITTTESTATNSTDAPTAEALIRRNPFNKKRLSDFNVFLAPDFPIGEAADYTDDYDYDAIRPKNPRKKYEPFYEDDDYGSYDDFSSPDYEFGPSKQSFQTYSPSSSYNLESKGSFSNKFRNFRRVPNLSGLSQIHNSPPATSYGVPFYGSPEIYTTPQSYISPKFEIPTVSTLENFHNVVEPVYMLTQTQLKELIGHHNLNIEHLDVYQVSKENKAKKPFHRPRKYRKRNPFRHVKSNLVKLHKFSV